MSELLTGLNEAQLEAVTATEGAIRVAAGAGSGKTRALTRRFAYLVNEIGVPPSNILCVTFTNKAANEMRQRIRALTGDSDTGYICTFHSFCVSVLQEEAHAVQYPQSFLVLDNSDIDQMLEIIYSERGLTLRSMTFSAARDMIEIKKTVTIPDYYEDLIAMPLDLLRRKYAEANVPEDIIFYGYLYQQKKCFGLDYNDLIKFTLYIFSKDADIRDKWRSRLEYIMVDEFQDIDKLQYTLMCELSGHHGNLFIVGDPDQTIYTWRGADVRYLLNFHLDFPQSRTIMMNRNYRSTPEIIAAANSLIAKNRNRMEKELTATLPSGAKPVYFHGKTSESEANWIAERIKQLAAGGVRLPDIAVLYRSHFCSRFLEESFIKAELPYTIFSGVQFFDRAEIKDALSYLRLIACRDDLSFTRVVNRPKRNIGERRMAFLREYAEQNSCLLFEALRRSLGNELFRNTEAEQFIELAEKYASKTRSMPVSELLSAVLEESGYEEALRTAGSGDRLDNLAELKQAVYDYETTCGEETVLESYLARVALFSNADAAEKNAVKLMTVHAAKGLEFPYVFLCAMEEGVFPSKKTSTPEGMEEERRLAFVAVTRAERELYLTDSQGRNLDGSYRFPSRFVLGIDEGLLEYVDPPEQSLIDEARRISDASERAQKNAAEPEFAAGDRVRHSILGEGTVTGSDTERGAYVIRFDRIATERKISWKIKLEKL